MLALLRRLRARLKYRHFDRDLAEEIEFHRAMKERELHAGGTPDARSASQSPQHRCSAPTCTG